MATFETKRLLLRPFRESDFVCGIVAQYRKKCYILNDEARKAFRRALK